MLDEAKLKFARSLDEALKVSEATANRKVDANLAWGTWLLTRCIGIGSNIEKLLAAGRFDNDSRSSLDFASVASLSRQLLECTLALYYITEDVSEDRR